MTDKDFIKVNYSELSNGWKFKDNKVSKLVNKLKKNKCLSDISINISQGIIPGSDKIYYLKILEDRDDKYLVNNLINDTPFEIEKFITKKIVKGNNLIRYVPPSYDFIVIYPYTKIKGGQKLYSELELQNEAPSAYRYLLKHKDFLVDLRKRYKTNPNEWYGYHRAREMDFLESDKILTTHASVNPSFTLSTNSEYFNQNIYGINLKEGISIYQVLAILNSRLTNFFMRNISNMIKGGYYLYKTNYISQIPIKIDSNNNLSSKANQELDLNHKLYLNQKSLINYIQSHFSISKVPNKLNVWNQLQFKDFINELNKAIKKSGYEKLSKSEEMEWMELFNEQKQKAQDLQSQITQTDREIDRMVYDLYGLTEEEIKIVEESVG